MLHETNANSMGESLLLFVAGAAIGGLLVALNTPKTGPELREDLRALGRKARNRAEGLTEDAGGAWDRLKGKARETGETVKQDLDDLTQV